MCNRHAVKTYTVHGGNVTSTLNPLGKSEELVEEKC
jgi:hypothetical protein